MKNILTLILRGVVLGSLMMYLGTPTARAARAHDGDFGAGIFIGEPTGLSAKYWLNHQSALNFGLGFSFNDYFIMYGDYVWQFHDVFPKQPEKFFQVLTPYVGAGVVLFVGGDSAKADRRGFTDNGKSSSGIGIRVPLGAEWRVENPTIAPYIELVPGIGLIPATYVLFQGGVGIRYYF